jgi:hypothetical protein
MLDVIHPTTNDFRNRKLGQDPEIALNPEALSTTEQRHGQFFFSVPLIQVAQGASAFGCDS